jgi:hypothetical protein
MIPEGFIRGEKNSWHILVVSQVSTPGFTRENDLSFTGPDGARELPF